ncbi:hypothetical protein [Mycolicibacter arupensis]|jgi:hypothetical protein|uniref:HNH endonuclease n=1 Tax=Mycolicibacter arupensis TaxID=342002 RepID=A0A0F5MXM1_9MYCO|nr:hypothetical protein [Mycolicibacter arupensis]KKB99446.1 hypothetical protein WR43_09490 [Mycolicibacter arupensis]MCV7277049.1 hypothetical protein [Mycolicibacter arupensis]OQZ91329.1 hypothetical protein BST15_20030 [Mycolicibacter arupensis]TXI50246.1 MAG: hypothetical protein E6Q54_21595 [Mycolicibacter arupensis]
MNHPRLLTEERVREIIRAEVGAFANLLVFGCPATLAAYVDGSLSVDAAAQLVDLKLKGGPGAPLGGAQ